MKFYDLIATEYKNISLKKKIYLNSVNKIIIKYLRKKKNILDAGSGDGLRLEKIRKKLKNKNFSAIEPSKKMYGLFKKNSKIPIKNIGLENIKDLNQKFDAITCLWNVFGHVSTNEKRLNILKDIKKKLNPKGYLIFDVNNRHNAKQYGIIKIIYRVLVDKFFFNEKRGDAKYEIIQENKKVKGNGHLFTIGEIELLIKKSNFQLKKVYFVNYSNGKVEKTPFFGQILVILEANN